MRASLPPTLSLFESAETEGDLELAPGGWLLHGFATDEATALLAAIDEIKKYSPLRNMMTPGGRMSVAMTNCGDVGWVSDRNGYRYDAIDPESGHAWPSMPAIFSRFAASAADRAGFPSFSPDACLVNAYFPGARLSLHQDKDESDFSAPIVSVSLGLPAKFVWGGPARMTFHGVDALADGDHPLTGALRYNLTFRRAR
jgi:alkylated DNA repair protein (DNA oxidative demethylase)